MTPLFTGCESHGWSDVIISNVLMTETHITVTNAKTNAKKNFILSPVYKHQNDKKVFTNNSSRINRRTPGQFDCSLRVFLNSDTPRQTTRPCLFLCRFYLCGVFFWGGVFFPDLIVTIPSTKNNVVFSLIHHVLFWSRPKMMPEMR